MLIYSYLIFAGYGKKVNTSYLNHVGLAQLCTIIPVEGCSTHGNPGFWLALIYPAFPAVQLSLWKTVCRCASCHLCTSLPPFLQFAAQHIQREKPSLLNEFISLHYAPRSQVIGSALYIDEWLRRSGCIFIIGLKYSYGPIMSLQQWGPVLQYQWFKCIQRALQDTYVAIQTCGGSMIAYKKMHARM